jgi:hypothetical protein
MYGANPKSFLQRNQKRVYWLHLSFMNDLVAIEYNSNLSSLHTVFQLNLVVVQLTLNLGIFLPCLVCGYMYENFSIKLPYVHLFGPFSVLMMNLTFLPWNAFAYVVGSHIKVKELNSCLGVNVLHLVTSNFNCILQINKYLLSPYD